MKLKLTLFSVLLYLTSFLSTLIFIGSSALFVNKIGAASVSKVIIAFGLLTPCVVFVLQKFYSKIKRYEYVFILYICTFLASIIGTSFLFINNMPTKAYWILYIIGFSGYSLNKIVSWSLVGRYFNVIDSRKYFSLLTAFQEGGSITSALLIKFFIVNADIATLVKFAFIPFLLILPIFFFILTPTVQYFKANKTPPTLDKEKRSLNTHLKFLKKSNAFIFLACLFLITIVFEQSIIYELNMTFGNQFKDVHKISSALSIYKICESSFVILASLFLGRLLRRFVSIGYIIIGYAVILTVAMLTLNINAIWFMVPIISFIRHSSKYFLFMPTYEQALNSLDTKTRIALKSLFEGFFAPICIIIAGFGLMFFPTIDMMKGLNLILLALAFLAIFCAFMFKDTYLKFHTKRLFSQSKELVIKSIQALGEHKNYMAIEPLLELLKSKPRVGIKKNIILSFGRMRIKNLLDVLYQEAKNEHEEVQIAAFESLSKFDSFLVQRFLIDLISGKTCKSLNARMSLLKILYSNLDVTIVPILMSYLNDEDERIVANSIEAMELVKDKRVVEVITPFLNHPNNRVKSNSIICLYKFKNCQKECDERLLELFNSKDVLANNSFIYVVGRLKLKKYKSMLSKFLKNEDCKLNLALAYSKLEDGIGYEMFAELISHKDIVEVKKCLHHFSQLEDGEKLRVLSLYTTKVKHEQQKTSLLKALKDSTLDFHEIRDFLKYQIVFDEST